MDHGGGVARRPLARRRRVRRRRRRRRASGNARSDRTGEADRRQAGRQARPSSVAGDVDYIDCGQSYYQAGYIICYATQRPLYSYKPDDGVNMVPDLAEALPEVSEDGKTVTVKIKHGRQVLAAGRPRGDLQGRQVRDGARCSSRRSPTATRFYFEDIVGAKAGAKPGHEDRGHRDARRPDDRVQALKATGGVMASGALALLGHRAGAGGVRGEVRQGDADDVRREPGRDRART